MPRTLITKAAYKWNLMLLLTEFKTLNLTLVSNKFWVSQIPKESLINQYLSGVHTLNLQKLIVTSKSQFTLKVLISKLLKMHFCQPKITILDLATKLDCGLMKHQQHNLVYVRCLTWRLSRLCKSKESMLEI